MKVYLAGMHSRRELMKTSQPKYILESFYTYKPWQIELIETCESFMLDSGAFTFMNDKAGKGVTTDALDKYVARYAEFVKENKIELFFELDVDAVAGIKKVEQMRRFIERATGRQPIPVWHKARGKDYFIGMCRDYPYVAVGGIVVKDITRTEYKYFRWLIDKAHEHGAKIHGLGFTQTNLLKKYRFDSVDSTSWLYGRIGLMYRFTGTSVVQIKLDNTRRKDFKKLDAHNIREWMKYQEYADRFM